MFFILSRFQDTCNVIPFRLGVGHSPFSYGGFIFSHGLRVIVSLARDNCLKGVRFERLNYRLRLASTP